MALDDAYFDGINIDVAKKKYYNVNKVEAVLQDIRREAVALTEENARLRQEVERMTSEKRSVGDALISARALAQQIVSEANAEAEEILWAAREQRSRMLAEAQEQTDYAAQYVQSTFERLKEQQLRAAKQLDADYQQFLCGLLQDDDPLSPSPAPTAAEPLEDPEKPEPTPAGTEPVNVEPASAAPRTETGELIPEDLREKVSAIAAALMELENE